MVSLSTIIAVDPFTVENGGTEVIPVPPEVGRRARPTLCHPTPEQAREALGRVLLRTFDRGGKLGLMTVYRNEGRYDTSNVVFADGEIQRYDKQTRLPEMRHIDYGLSLFRAEAFAEYPVGTRFDLAELMGRLVARRQLAGYEVPERFYQIGSPAGLAELDALLKAKGGK